MINLRKNQLFILIASLFLSFATSYTLPAMGTSPPVSNNPDISECKFRTVSRIIDGDTLELSDGTKVRLLGVDTPETNDPRKDVQWFGKEASKKLKEWIEGKTVCLKQDKDKTQDVDKYGRLLRYIWKNTIDKQSSDKDRVGKIFFVNAELIKQGYGFAYTRYPFEYLEDFRKYERVARENNRGLWNKKKQELWERNIKESIMVSRTCGKANTICPDDAINHAGKNRTVRFFVRKSFDNRKVIFLNSKNNYKDHDNFTAVIFKANRNKFPAQSANFYWGKTVDVTGRIKEYKGRAEIIMKESLQIKVIDSYPDPLE